MQAFHDIESLRHVVEDVKRHCEFAGLEVRPTIKFRGTVKLHGTNGGVKVFGDDVIAQGRNRVLTIKDDNFGFAHFVAGRESLFKQLAVNFIHSDEVTFYGEWCGQGIQKKVAIADLPKRFVIFAVYDHNSDEWVDLTTWPSLMFLSYDMLNQNGIYLITQAPTFEVEIDFNNPVPAAEELSRLTLQVEECCPFSKEFGVEGMGEGIVWVSYDYPHRLYFKTKGEKHKKAGTERRHVEVDPEKVSGISALVDLLLPAWRLEQGFQYLRENNIAVANTSTGEYLKWIAKDILKEEEDRIAANPYPWKDVQGTVMTRAKAYFFEKLNEEAGLPSASA